MELTGRFVVSEFGNLKKVERLSELGGYGRFHLNFIEYVNEPMDSFAYVEWLSYNVFAMKTNEYKRLRSCAHIGCGLFVCPNYIESSKLNDYDYKNLPIILGMITKR